jgi:hypothetical protein
VIASASIHIDVVDVTYVNGNGTAMTTGVDSEPEEDLLAAAGESNGNSDTQPLSQDFQANLSNDEFQVELDGLAPSDVQSLTEAGNSVPIQSATAPAGGGTVAATPDELVDGDDDLTHADDAQITQQTGDTVVANDASITVQTPMDSFNAAVPNSQSTAQDDFFFDGTDNNSTTNTNVWEMDLEDKNLGTQGQSHYEAGTTDSATGWNCADIAQDAFGALETDIDNDPNRVIDIVGFSRGSAEAVDFANLVTNALNAGQLTYMQGLHQEVAKNITIRFIGVYDLVTCIDGIDGNPGSLMLTLPKGVGLVAHAVALSEERADFEFSDLSQLNPNSDPLDQLGFRGVHSDIGGDAQGPNVKDPLTAVTLDWMNNEAKTAGWNTLNVSLETINQITDNTIAPLVATPAAYNAQSVNQIYWATYYGIPHFYFLQYRNFRTTDPTLQCWQPGVSDLAHMPLYTSQAPPFWDPNLAINSLPSLPLPLQITNGA